MIIYASDVDFVFMQAWLEKRMLNKSYLFFLFIYSSVLLELIIATLLKVFELFLVTFHKQRHKRNNWGLHFSWGKFEEMIKINLPSKAEGFWLFHCSSVHAALVYRRKKQIKKPLFKLSRTWCEAHFYVNYLTLLSSMQRFACNKNKNKKIYTSNYIAILY